MTVNVGILAVDDVLDDGVERWFAEVVSVDAAADMAEGIERSGVGDGDVIAVCLNRAVSRRIRTAPPHRAR